MLVRTVFATFVALLPLVAAANHHNQEAGQIRAFGANPAHHAHATHLPSSPARRRNSQRGASPDRGQAQETDIPNVGLPLEGKNGRLGERDLGWGSGFSTAFNFPMSSFGSGRGGDCSASAAPSSSTGTAPPSSSSSNSGRFGSSSGSGSGSYKGSGSGSSPGSSSGSGEGSGRGSSSGSGSGSYKGSGSGSSPGSSSGSGEGSGRGSSSGSGSGSNEGSGNGSSSGSSSGSGNSGTGGSSWNDQVLQYHNQVRSKHQAPALTWDSSLEQYASHYLSTNNCEFKHSDGPHGENIAIGYKGMGALEGWYNEYKDYPFDNPGYTQGTGHFTQMVWKATKKLGCAKKACDRGEYVVCEYDPPGNVNSGDEFSKNVSPAK